MRSNARTDKAIAFMTEFAEATGLVPGKSASERYLWTDAFAVCNFLELFRLTGEKRYLDLALKLVDEVHFVLGRFSSKDPRTGWISGLDGREAREHPTIGGLRIGKPLLERGEDEPLDQRTEWDRDGQYYHYLTKWMHALNRVSRVTGDMKYHRWAVDLAKTAHAAFTYVSPVDGRMRMYWKMSVDLSRPLVPSMGQHDPLDGYVTYNELQMCGPRALMDQGEYPELSAEIRNIAEICQGMDIVTDDPLGLGGLLFDSCRIAWMLNAGYMKDIELLSSLLNGAAEGLRYFLGSRLLEQPAEYRLAFRELGLSIGLHGVEVVRDWQQDRDSMLNNGSTSSLEQALARVEKHVSLIPLIEEFWLDSSNRASGTWTEHRDINGVMLATSLCPKGFLVI